MKKAITLKSVFRGGLTAGMLAAGLLAGARATGQDAPAAAQDKPATVNALVMLGDYAREGVDASLREKLAANGINLVSRAIDAPMDPAMLRQFHVLVIAGWGGPGVWSFNPGQLPSSLTLLRNLELMKEFIREGGGLLYIPAAGGGDNPFLSEFGAGIENAQVRDDVRAWYGEKGAPSGAERKGVVSYAWTTAVTPHPATEGVERLFYPTPMLRWDDMYATPALTLRDKAWTALVRGMQTSVASRYLDYTTWMPVGEKAPALAAVRENGKGRVGLFAPTALYTLVKPYAIFPNGWYREQATGIIDGIMLEKGDGTQPSHGLKLLTGMLRWLGANAAAAGFGTFDEATYTAMNPAGAETPEWIRSWRAGDANTWHKVLVGARSVYSDGHGCIAQYAAAARAAGIGLLFMTETFERFDPAKWKEYLADCAAASDETLKVIPGLDIGDDYGNRFLLLGSPTFPQPSLLTADGKLLAKPQYLCLCFPRATTVQHRASTTAVPHELHKFFQGVSIYTYRDGKLVDNSLPAYEWQLFRFSNPMPYVVHETYSPADLEKEASTGHQLLVPAPSLTEAAWYLSEHGLSHGWESPVRLQVTAGPRLVSWGGSTPDPREPSVHGAISFAIEAEEPLREVRLMENFNLYRRWTPNTNAFAVNNIKLPEEHVNWVYLSATDAKGRTLVSPGILFGKQIAHTWRCLDRQNWWSFPNIYTGSAVSQFDLRVPVFGTAEGQGIFPQWHGPLSGENMAPLMDFNYAGPAAYLQDVFLDQRYPRATFEENIGFDARPSNLPARSRVYAARIRSHQFFVIPQKQSDLPPESQGTLPLYNTVEITLRRPVDPAGDIFPVLTTLDTKHIQVRGDMTWAYPGADGKEVTGSLKKGFIDLPRGGRVGGLIALSDGLRVGADGQVGFAAPGWNNGALPVGTSWRGAFMGVQPAEADQWRRLFGFLGDRPYEIKLTRGTMDAWHCLAECRADGYGIAGSVERALPAEFLGKCTGGLVNNNGEGKGKPITQFYLPVFISGINYNWPAAVVRDGQVTDDFDVYEGKGVARLNVGVAGPFYIGNTVTATEPNLRIGLLRWTAAACDLEVNNPTDRAIDAEISTVAGLKERFNGRKSVRLPAGSSLLVKLAE